MIATSVTPPPPAVQTRTSRGRRGAARRPPSPCRSIAALDPLRSAAPRRGGSPGTRHSRPRTGRTRRRRRARTAASARSPASSTSTACRGAAEASGRPHRRTPGNARAAETRTPSTRRTGRRRGGDLLQSARAARPDPARRPSAQDFPLELDAGFLAVPRLRRDARLAQVALLELVRLGPRQLVQVLDEARHPVRRHPAGEVLDERCRFELGPRLEHDRDLDLLVAGGLVEV